MDELIRKQDAIKEICEDIEWLESQGCTEIPLAERKERDVDIIEKLPPVQSDVPDMNVGDMISRQAAIDAVLDRMDIEKYGRNAKPEEIRWTLEKLPPVQPQQMKGRWLPDNNFAYEMRFVCSVCKESEVVPTIGFTKYKPIWDFCPNCGADMRGNEDGTDL